MNILQTIRKGQLDHRYKEDIDPTHCTLSYDEGFDLLDALLTANSLNLTHMQKAELTVVFREKNVAGLIQAFGGATIYGMQIVLQENT